MHVKALILAALTQTVLSACSTQSDSPNLGLANPAAIYCADQGGSYHLDSGTCELPDGQQVDGWEYYRSQP
ncbi:putative hemolysin [Halopseudomonas sabulinigri]|uniref:DUF333 domain-containing protein n=1 Tax=Halopseudomonas sabulinigri TaxID=472181 RepID=A0ABP9ZRJ8_9GAMM